MGHIHQHLLFNDFRRLLIIACKGMERSIFLILRVIKHGHINSRNLTGSFQKFPATLSLCLIFLINIKQLVIDRLAFSDIENIKKLGNRFRIIDTGTASDDDRIFLRTF